MTNSLEQRVVRPEESELLRAADRVASAVRERALQTERERRVSADMVQLMRRGSWITGSPRPKTSSS
jgi:hypothetical protein